LSQYIIDTDVLIVFYCRLERPDVLHDVCAEGVVVAETVRREMEGVARGMGRDVFRGDVANGSVRVIEAGPAEANEAADFNTTFLHRGEKDTAAIALTHLYEMITNDRMARNELVGSGITVHDAAWVLGQAKSRRLLTQAEHKNLAKRLGRQW
jgi:predicted nucleic acid-binding protein